MFRGTTPTHIFTLPEDYYGVTADALYITYSQNKKTVLEKVLSDVVFGSEGVAVRLSQAETLLFSEGGVKIQLRAKLRDGTAVASGIIQTTTHDILKDGVI